MKSWLTFSVCIVLAIGGYNLFSCRPRKDNPKKVISQNLLVQVNDFSSFIKKEFLPAVQDGADEEHLQSLFFSARLLYKRFEWAAEYFTGSTTRFVNGPPVPEISLTGLYTFPPEGLQVIEGYLFPAYDNTKKEELLGYLKLLLQRCEAYRAYFNHIPIADWQVFDATKLEVFRILSLGITGFDNPLSLHSMEESAICLQSIQEVLKPYIKIEKETSLMTVLKDAVHYLRRHPDFNTFDRAIFIREYGNKISSRIGILQQRLQIQFIKYNRLLRQEAPTLFDENAFNVNAYGPGVNGQMTDQRKTLGKKLFFDPILSANQRRSCASCHQPENAFSDGLVKNTTIDGRVNLQRNTPSLLYAAFQPLQFYDLRASSLEAQVKDVVENKDEMHGSLNKAVKILEEDEVYRNLFLNAFSKKQGESIDPFEVANAISIYVRSLNHLNSRFDAYMRGNDTALHEQEIKGFNLFMGKAKCATCHYMPLFNGTFPPKYYAVDAEVIGTPSAIADTLIDSDVGRYAVMPFESLKYAFKTPTVRNASKTAPYMHNGVFSTLDEVLDFYNKGGGLGMGIAVDNQTLSADSLQLTSKEISELTAFIKSLDDQ